MAHAAQRGRCRSSELTATSSAFVVQRGGQLGRGECVPGARYGQTVARVVQAPLLPTGQATTEALSPSFGLCVRRRKRGLHDGDDGGLQRVFTHPLLRLRTSSATHSRW